MRKGGSALSAIYARRQIFEIGAQLLLILLLVEGIFLAEKLTDILGGLLSKEASGPEIALLVLYAVPEVFNLAFPIALLIAIYRTLLNGREGREFVVLAGVGVGSSQLMVLLLLGVAMQLCSFAISNTVEPTASYWSRSTLFSITYQALRSNSSSGQTLSFPDSIIFVAPRPTGKRDGPVFIEKLRSRVPIQVSTAETAHLEGPNEDGLFTLRMRGLNVVDTSQRAGGAGLVPTSSIRAGTYSQEVSLDDFLRFPARGESPVEQSSLDIVTAGSNSVGQVTEFGTRLSRSLLCFLAPFLACVAMLYTGRASQGFMLPLCCGLMMAIDIASATGIKAIANAGISALQLLALSTSVAIAVAVGMAALIKQRHDLLVYPQLTRV